MSAGDFVLPTAATVTNDMEVLAPKFKIAIVAALAECDSLGLDAMVYETYRTDALARVYYARGRTVKPPEKPVTNAHDNVHSWHGFSLAADVIHQTRPWDATPSGWVRVAQVFKRHGCAWGGDWRGFRDLPHYQWALCPASPTDADRALLVGEGIEAVWEKYGAL